MRHSGQDRENDEALESAGASQNLLSSRIGVAYARAGAVQKAERVMNLLRSRADPANPAETSEMHRLEGEVALARGDAARALEYLGAAERQSANPLTMESLAHAHQVTGDDARRAIACYRRLIGMGGRSLGWEPQQAWLAAHIGLAEADLSHGEKSRSAFLIDRFNTAWRNADGDLPLASRAAELIPLVGGAR